MITVEGLGKRYRIQHRYERQQYVALRDVLTQMISAPFRRLRGGAAEARTTEDFWALKDVSFAVKPGEVIGIIGRNGAGKSTLLKVLSRITEPTEGRVTLEGRVASLLEVGTGFHPELTGRENIFLNGAILGMSRSEIASKFDEIVAFAEVDKFLDTPVKRYSSGMYVRLAFAVAAHIQSEILIVDEVLAVGDAEFQKKCLGKMDDVASHGRTVLFVSHNLALVESMCTRAILLGAGRVSHDGDVADAISRYYANHAPAMGQATAFDRDRGTTGVAVLVSACLVDQAGHPLHQVPLGGAFILDIGVRPERPLRAPSVGIGIDDMSGQRMLTLHNPVHWNPADGGLRPGTIRCRVPQFPLAPGEYTIKLAISDHSEEIEAIDRAVAFEVVNADGLKDGRGHWRGVCVAASEWTYSTGDYDSVTTR